MLAKNPLLEEIAAQLAVGKFDMDAAVDEYLDRKIVSNGVDATLDIWSQVVGYVAEIGVKMMLERIVEPYGSRISFDPIPHLSETENYLFRYTSLGNLHAYNKKLKNYAAEYDLLFLADEIPVVVEVKLRGCNSSVWPTSRWTKSIRPNLWTAKLYPLEQYFGCYCGYMMVVLQKSMSLDPQIR